MKENRLDAVLKRHELLFQEGLGKLHVQGYKAKLQIDLDAHAKFFKARTVLYAMKEKIEQEIDRLVEVGIIEPMQFSDWAAPHSTCTKIR